MRFLLVVLLCLAAIPATAGSLTYTTTADEDTTLALAAAQFNAARPGRPVLSRQQYFEEYVRQMLGSLRTRVEHQQSRTREFRFEALPLPERQRILNQMECKQDTCP